jgi:hypothetical protein
MSVTSYRSVVVNFTGDFEYTQEFPVAGPVTSTTSPGQNQLITVNTTATAVTIPSGSVGVTIIPPVSNTTATLSVTDSTGVVAVNTGTTGVNSFSLSTTATLYLKASASLSNVRVIFS